MYYYLEAGGPLMWVLLIMSILSVAIILERTCFFFFRQKIHNKNFYSDIIKAVNENNIQGAIEICQREKNSIGYTVSEFLNRYDTKGDFYHFEQLIKEIEIDTLDSLEKRLHFLGLIGNTAPMVGLLGTVTGMIKAFTNLASFGAGDATVVAGGISEALITTAGGLFIAIPTIVAYNLFNRKIDSIESDIDKITTTLVNILRRK